MLKKAKRVALNFLKHAGIFELVASSSWRQKRLLILCYHGMSLGDEHLWRPRLYMQPDFLEKRLQALRDSHCSVFLLAEALRRLASDDLPPRSVAVTFDDGTYDFYKLAYPLLRKYDVPVTLYQTTYYSDLQVPIFNLVSSYLLWKRKGEQIPKPSELGLSIDMDLRTEQSRHRVVRGLIEFSERENLSGRQKNELASRLAAVLGIDYASLITKRLFQLMNPQEVADVASHGVDVQLHTHRHRTPADEDLFRKEIAENRQRIRAFTGKEAHHFCYPGGVYREDFLSWLQKEKILSATTCDTGMASRQTNPLLLPRFVDSSGIATIQFQSWLSGIGHLLAFRRLAPQSYVPEE